MSEMLRGSLFDMGADEEDIDLMMPFQPEDEMVYMVMEHL